MKSLKDSNILGILLAINLGAFIWFMNQPDEYEVPDYDYEPSKSNMTLYQGTNPALDYMPPVVEKSDGSTIIIGVPDRFKAPNQDLDDYIENYIEENPELIEEYLNR